MEIGYYYKDDIISRSIIFHPYKYLNYMHEHYKSFSKVSLLTGLLKVC